MALQLKPTCNNLVLVGWNTLLCSLDSCGCAGSSHCRYTPEYTCCSKKAGCGIDYPTMDFEYLPLNTKGIKEVAVTVVKTHTGRTSHPAYAAWHSLVDRCTNPNNPSFMKCKGLLWEPWRDAEVFYAAFPEYEKGDRFRRLNPALGFTPENYRIKKS